MTITNAPAHEKLAVTGYSPIVDVKGVKIDPSLMKPEEVEILEDLLVTAHADARRKAETAMQEKMQSLTGGLGLPPGFLGLGS